MYHGFKTFTTRGHCCKAKKMLRFGWRWVVIAKQEGSWFELPVWLFHWLPKISPSVGNPTQMERRSKKLTGPQTEEGRNTEKVMSKEAVTNSTRISASRRRHEEFDL